MFSPGSRYESVSNGIYTDRSGRRIGYKLLRIIPPTSSIQAYTVQQGDRLDVVAFNFYRDPEQFWRICDANNALRPEELVQTTGRRLLIPLPQR